MSAPTSGSSGSSSSSAFPPASGSASQAPAPGYYPDPSIPNYIRYWNGSAWVPGTSRPAPPEGDGVIPPRVPAIDESGPMFLDEDPAAPAADLGVAHDAHDAHGAVQPADPRAQGPSWPEPRQSPQLPPVSWGAQPGFEAQQGALPAQQGHLPAQQQPPHPEPPQPVPPYPAPPRPLPPQSLPPQSRAGQLFGGPEPAVPAQPQPQPQPHRQPQPQSQPAVQPLPSVPPQAGAPQPVPWAAQVQDLARGEGGVAPWRPVPSDPFGASRGHDRPGGLGRRFAARVIDGVLLAALTGAAAVPLGSAAYHHAKDKVDQARLTGETVRVWLIDGTTGVQLGAVLAVFLAAGLLLEVLPTAKWGRTAGKKLVGLRVLDIEGQLPPSFTTSLRRWLTRTVLDLLAIGVVSAAWCLIDRPWKQCWHDKAARTFVAES